MSIFSGKKASEGNEQRVYMRNTGCFTPREEKWQRESVLTYIKETEEADKEDSFSIGKEAIINYFLFFPANAPQKKDQTPPQQRACIINVNRFANSIIVYMHN
jgi:hypothetical protein